MGLAGPAVLLLNLAHPLVAAAVHDHSHWPRDPVGRIKATAGFMETIYFGDLDEARAAAERLWRMHGAVTGTSPDGRSYAARDPKLLGWVWESTIWTLARARPLLLGTAAGRMDDCRWREATVLAGASGIPVAARPQSFAELERRIDARLGQEIRVGGRRASSRPPGAPARTQRSIRRLRGACGVLCVGPRRRSSVSWT